jgi:DNA-binding XRE family transcriptional regulator
VTKIKMNTKKLIELRIKQGLSSLALGKKAEISSGAIWALENDTRDPSAATAKKITDALGVEFDELFTIEEG